jgi:hypothetical protein
MPNNKLFDLERIRDDMETLDRTFESKSDIGLKADKLLLSAIKTMRMNCGRGTGAIVGEIVDAYEAVKGL